MCWHCLINSFYSRKMLQRDETTWVAGKKGGSHKKKTKERKNHNTIFYILTVKNGKKYGFGVNILKWVRCTKGFMLLLVSLTFNNKLFIKIIMTNLPRNLTISTSLWYVDITVHWIEGLVFNLREIKIMCWVLVTKAISKKTYQRVFKMKVGKMAS